MRTTIRTAKPFNFRQAVTFIARFPACQRDTVIAGDTISAALAVDGKGYAFTLHEHSNDDVGLEIHQPVTKQVRDELARRAGEFLGAGDDLAPFYAAARGDAPLERTIRQLHGLHHVRFLAGLPEISVYAVMMQRTPAHLAARLKTRFLAAFGVPAQLGDRELRAMPALADLATLDAADIATAIGHRAKADRIAGVVRGVAAIGEDYLRTAPYAEARDALLAIPGVGPFSAAAILLRGLGRVQQLHTLDWFADDARLLYGDAWDPAAIAARYAGAIGYWSFYVKTAAARVAA